MSRHPGIARGDLVVITGAAGGFGRAIALRLVEDGAKVSLWDIDEPGLAETAKQCRAKGGTASIAIADTSAPTSVAAAAATLDAPPFALVNNAGIFPQAEVRDASPDLWRKVIEVNLLGYVFVAQAVMKMMEEAGGGVIVNMSSAVAIKGVIGGAHYAASKAGVLGFTKSLAREVAPNIRVNAIMPGIVETAFPLAYMTSDEIQAIGGRIPLQRIGTVEDVAGMVAFLLSKDAAFLTGQAIALNGGDTMVP